MLTAGIDIGHESGSAGTLRDDGTMGHATLVISSDIDAGARLAFGP